MRSSRFKRAGARPSPAEFMRRRTIWRAWSQNETDSHLGWMSSNFTGARSRRAHTDCAGAPSRGHDSDLTFAPQTITLPLGARRRACGLLDSLVSNITRSSSLCSRLYVDEAIFTEVTGRLGRSAGTPTGIIPQQRLVRFGGRTRSLWALWIIKRFSEIEFVRQLYHPLVSARDFLVRFATRDTCRSFGFVEEAARHTHLHVRQRRCVCAPRASRALGEATSP